MMDTDRLGEDRMEGPRMTRVPGWFRWGLQVLALTCLAVAGPNLVEAAAERRGEPPRDFAQDWASARNFFEGERIYAPLEVTLPRYVYQPRKGERAFLRHNGHPPGSVLLVLPLGRLDYYTAHVAWQGINLAALLAGLVIVVRELRVEVSAWHVLPTAAFLVLYDPVRLQFINGNWNALLFLGVTAVWALARRRRDVAAGLVLGVVASIKLYPAFVGLYFLARRRWGGLAGAAIGFGVMQLAAAGLFGWEAFTDYRRTITEGAGYFQGVWTNGSLPGFASKLFHPGTAWTDRLIPLWDAPWLATALTVVAFVALAAATGRFAWSARTPVEEDEAFALVLTAGVLLSPLIWVDGSLLLLMPIFLLWQRASPWPRGRVVAAVGLWVLVQTQQWVLEWLQTWPTGERMHPPGRTLTYLSTLGYAYVTFHALQWWVFLKRR